MGGRRPDEQYMDGRQLNVRHIMALHITPLHQNVHIIIGRNSSGMSCTVLKNGQKKEARQRTMFYTVRQRACFMGLLCEIALWVTLLARVISFADELIACSVEIELIALLHLFDAAAIRIVEFLGVLVGDIVCASSTITTSATAHNRRTRRLRLNNLACCE